MTELDYEDRQLLRKRVYLGAEWLDEKRPGWWQSIDLDRLDISDCDRCVLGQVFGGFLVGVQKCGLLSYPSLTDMGLALDYRYDGQRDDYWAVVKDAWCEQILDRRIAADTDG